MQKEVLAPGACTPALGHSAGRTQPPPSRWGDCGKKQNKRLLSVLGPVTNTLKLCLEQALCISITLTEPHAPAPALR